VYGENTSRIPFYTYAQAFIGTFMVVLVFVVSIVMIQTPRGSTWRQQRRNWFAKRTISKEQCWMVVTRERFEQGMSYEAYKAQMTRNRDRFEENERTATFGEEDMEFFRQLPQPLHALVITEDWCGDAVANVPVLGRLAQESGKLNLRVFLRDQNPDIMDQYLNEGVHRSIPVFVFFDQDFRELGHWIERPAAVSQMQGKMLDELFATEPALQGVPRETSPAQLPEAARTRLMQAMMGFRTEIRETSDREVVREIRELIERGLRSTL
jgi:hypothetical protein